MSIASGSVRAVMFFVDAPQNVARWWSDLMGLEPLQENGFWWINLDDGTELGFHPADQDKNPHGGSCVAYFAVADLDAAVASVLERGGRLHRGPLDVEPNRRIAQLVDPFGNVFGLDGRAPLA